MQPPLEDPRTSDAFGHVLARCWQAGATPWSAVEIIERDDGLIRANDAARYFGAREEWPTLEQWAWAQATGRVLDVGCGGGRHAVEWLGRGHEVVGVDPSAEAVRITRERGVEAVVASLPELPDGLGRFDTIALMGNNLGLLGGPDRAPRVLATLAAVSRPGALLIASGSDPGDGGTDHRAYHARNLRHGRARGQLRLRVRDEATATPWFDYWLAAPDELTAPIDASPWTLETLRREPGGSGYVVCLRR
ncbi:methyltransferase domain-containing protein [Streptomyces sp. NBC_01016]|uniref:class I SAM-dependent methyltransferase n=1 Tax=Streptomyces sp. NBC_01016 TaxID=2903720 RepID=UPI00224D484C|nr:class I SAM-dependent methyltransferase [Streptomyces sp. NBC_01016]MCX4835478.1 methyltransferase domain-containing protein [Streptomyces sp. NBC_01016]